MDVNARAADGSTALHWAAQNDDMAIAEALIGKGAGPSAATDLGVTPLWIAASNSGTAMVERLLAAHADPEHRAADARHSADGRGAARQYGGGQGPAGARRGTPTRKRGRPWPDGPDVGGLGPLSGHGAPAAGRGADVRARDQNPGSNASLLCCQYTGEIEGAAVVHMGGYTALHVRRPGRRRGVRQAAGGRRGRPQGQRPRTAPAPW